MEGIEEKENELIRRANQGDGVCFNVTHDEYMFLLFHTEHSSRDTETNASYWRGLKLVVEEKVNA